MLCARLLPAAIAYMQILPALRAAETCTIFLWQLKKLFLISSEVGIRENTSYYLIPDPVHLQRRKGWKKFTKTVTKNAC